VPSVICADVWAKGDAKKNDERRLCCVRTYACDFACVHWV